MASLFGCVGAGGGSPPSLPAAAVPVRVAVGDEAPADGEDTSLPQMVERLNYIQYDILQDISETLQRHAVRLDSLEQSTCFSWIFEGKTRTTYGR